MAESLEFLNLFLVLHFHQQNLLQLKRVHVYADLYFVQPLIYQIKFFRSCCLVYLYVHLHVLYGQLLGLMKLFVFSLK